MRAWLRAALLVAGGTACALAQAVDCAACHQQQAGEHALSAHGRELKRGNAAAPGCATCHGDAHEGRAGTADFRKAVPELCGVCHAEIAAEFQTSVHGKASARGRVDAPVCTDCHGEHSILRPKDTSSAVHPRHIRETCARCHDDVRLARRWGLPPDRLTTFDSSFHGLAAKTGSQTVANCASCHGFHNILPSNDAKSTIHPARLAATCGRCHPGAGRRFALGTIHTAPGGAEAAPVRWARIFYLVVIPVVIGLMVLHQGGDWVRKLGRLRFSGQPPPAPAIAAAEIRMYPLERIQHALLMLSFFTLVWTGFALKYPDTWWAWPMVAMESRWAMRGLLHRIAGVMLIGLAIAHIVSLTWNARLRAHWLHLLPRRTDAGDAARGLAFNLGLARRGPPATAHGYMEKAEYWAVVWGTAIMALTGLMLWADNFMLRWLPKTWLDFATTVHFYEAILATLAIVVWHFYSVLFDPEVYPMDPAWIAGRSVRPRQPESPPPEPTPDHLEDAEQHV